MELGVLESGLPRNLIILVIVRSYQSRVKLSGHAHKYMVNHLETLSDNDDIIFGFGHIYSQLILLLWDFMV